MKPLKFEKEQVLMALYLVVIAAGLLFVRQKAAVPAFSFPTAKLVVMIDAGHGGWDPGKVAPDKTYEKDINLAIAGKLQSFLEQSGSFVVTTRAEDAALSDTKSGDMGARRSLADESGADILVSIHQNSYPAQSVNGAQVFYYNASDESKALAEAIQARLVSYLDPNNRREAKANTDYYMLKRTGIPAVIVECGFLTNEKELKKLKSGEYQEKVAWAIYLGLIDYCGAN